MREMLPVAILAQGLLVLWAAQGERPPAPPDLTRFPSEFGNWKQLREDPIQQDVRDQLKADQILSRTYMTPDNKDAGLLVAWFRSQTQGGQPHSPQVCLPGSGWIPSLTDVVRIPTEAGAIESNRYIVTNQGARAVVLYWYQTSHRVITGEWAAKFWVIPDALRDKRTDTSLVRVVTYANGSSDPEATATAVSFASRLYPMLHDQLPR